MLRIFFQEKTTNTINFSNDIIILFLFGFTEFASSIFLLIAIIKIFNNIFEENYYLNYYFKKVFDLIKLKKEKILLISEFLATIVIFALLSTSVFEILFLLKKNSFDTTNQKYFFSENYKLIYYLIVVSCLSAFIRNIHKNYNYYIKITILSNLLLGLITIFYYKEIILSPSLYLNLRLFISLIELIALYLCIKTIVNKRVILLITADIRNIYFFKNIILFFFINNFFNIFSIITILIIKLPTHVIFFYISTQLIIYLQNIFFSNSYKKIFDELYSIPFNMNKKKLYDFQNFSIKKIFATSSILTLFIYYFLNDVLNITHRYFKIDYDNFQIHSEIISIVVLCLPFICLFKLFNIIYFYREERSIKTIFYLDFLLINIYFLIVFFKLVIFQNIFLVFIFLNYLILSIHLFYLLKEKAHKF